MNGREKKDCMGGMCVSVWASGSARMCLSRKKRCHVASAVCCDPADSNKVVFLSILGLSSCLRNLNTCWEDVCVCARVHHSMGFSTSRVVCQVPVIPGIWPKHLSLSRCSTSKSAVVKCSRPDIPAGFPSFRPLSRVSQRLGNFANPKPVLLMTSTSSADPYPLVQASVSPHGCSLTFWQ